MRNAERPKIEGLVRGLTVAANFAGSKPIHEALGFRYDDIHTMHDVLGVLCEMDSSPLKSIGGDGKTPLHIVCGNPGNRDPRIVRMLLNHWPESVNHRDDIRRLPLHDLCCSRGSDAAPSVDILSLLLDAAPRSVREWVDGDLPIHCAMYVGHSTEFCRMLIDAYPESLGIQTESGRLPIHLACCESDNVGTVQYLLERDPHSISARDAGGDLPIHCAAESDQQLHKAEIIKSLLKEDPDCASKPDGVQYLPLHLTCNGFHRNACIESVRVLFDAYPEAIDIEAENGRTPLELARVRSQGAEIVEFLEAQLAYARQAEDTAVMHMPDQNGWLPLHHALRNNACLGAIKLLLKGNPAALQVIAGDRRSFPVHIACEFSAIDVVQYLLKLEDSELLHSCDATGDSTLHYACRGGNLGVVKSLLESHDGPLVSEPNIDGKLPIHLLWESDRVDRQSMEYVEAILLLLLAHPET